MKVNQLVLGANPLEKTIKDQIVPDYHISIDLVDKDGK